MSAGADLPWTAAEALPDVDWPGFVRRLAGCTDRLAERQSAVTGRPDAVADLERAVEADLVALVLDVFGDVDVLAEEHFNAFDTLAHRAGAPDAAALSFALDPLDGSRSYTSGSSTYGVSLAGCRDGVPVFGLVYQPHRRLLYAAAAGAGAYAGAVRLTVPETAPRQAAVRSGTADVPQIARAVAALRERGYALENMECTSLKFCWVAEGRRAGLVKRLVERDGVLCTWGTAAGQLIAAEAGVRCVSLAGGPWRWAAGPVACGDRRFLADLPDGSAPDESVREQR